MKRFQFFLFGLIVLLSGSATAQEMHGFELRDGQYFWTGRFVSEGMGADELKSAIIDKLSASPFIGQVRATGNGRVVGSIRDLPEAINSVGMLVFNFGFSIEVSDGEYFVTTSDWVGKSTNPELSGVVLRLEEMLTGPLVGKRRKENFFKAHEDAQVKIFRLD